MVNNTNQVYIYRALKDADRKTKRTKEYNF